MKKILSLFSGAGGLSCGFEKAGLNCLAGIDFSKSAIETFKNNHKKAVGIDGDIRKISIKEFKKKLIIKKSTLFVVDHLAKDFLL